MRYLIRTTSALTIFCVLLALSACSRTVLSPSDELVMNRWGTVTENGNQIDLRFDEDVAALTAHSDSFSLTIRGIYDADDASLPITDEGTHLSYRFTYVLYGDRIELTYGGGTLSLGKK